MLRERVGSIICHALQWHHVWRKKRKRYVGGRKKRAEGAESNLQSTMNTLSRTSAGAFDIMCGIYAWRRIPRKRSESRDRASKKSWQSWRDHRVRQVVSSFGEEALHPFKGRSPHFFFHSFVLERVDVEQSISKDYHHHQCVVVWKKKETMLCWSFKKSMGTDDCSPTDFMVSCGSNFFSSFFLFRGQRRMYHQDANRIKTRKGRSTLMMAPSKWGFPVAPYKEPDANHLWRAYFFFLYSAVSITGVDAI